MEAEIVFCGVGILPALSCDRLSGLSHKKKMYLLALGYTLQQLLIAIDKVIIIWIKLTQLFIECYEPKH